MSGKKNILVIGGAGYVGSALVPELLKRGMSVTVFDTYWYGNIFRGNPSPNLHQIKGDVRDREALVSACNGIDTIIHLACISNDPSVDLDPALGRSINRDAFLHALEGAQMGKVNRFIFASSSSVYGVREEDQVVEDTPTTPLTDYSKFKLACEYMLSEAPDIPEKVVLRPATVCGYSPRLRLDLAVNTLAMSAIEKGVITVFGGQQIRPNINIKDMIRAYMVVLEQDANKVNGQTFNVGYQNLSIDQIAETVRTVVPSARVDHKPIHDNRSYRVNSDKIARVLGFNPIYTIQDAIFSLREAYYRGAIVGGMDNPIYHNIKRMKQLRAQ
jgi:nucleoside-diphosphate-sugar epimerase